VASDGAIGSAEGIELQHRALGEFIRLLGRSSEGAQVIEREGVIASVVPQVPDRSVLNSVTYRDGRTLAAVLDDLAAAYDEAGVVAWTVWTPESDANAIAALETAGHSLDAAPTAMFLDLAHPPEPDPDDELDWDGDATPEEVGRLNNEAYGYGERGGFAAALASPPEDIPLRLYRARVDGELASVTGTIDAGSDCGVYFVATRKGYRGHRLAGRLMQRALLEARDRGLETSTLQSTKMGRSAYERLGYSAPFTIEMWERRK